MPRSQRQVPPARQNRVSKNSVRKPKETLNPRTSLYTALFQDLAEQNEAVEEPTLPAGATTKREVFQDLRHKKPADKKAAKQYLQDVKSLGNAYSIFGREMVQASDCGRWSLKGMDSTLKSHQLLGSAFMIKRERGNKAPYGGVLADVMGMGKTVQTLATAVGDLQRFERRPTLIVVPPSLLGQWEQECRKHIHASSEVTFRSYQIRHFWAARGQHLTELYRQNIWLTTYQEVQSSYRVHHQVDTGITDEEHEELKRTVGLLHSADFYRIVLDEGQLIRNPDTLRYKSCFSLKGHARWILSGTPLMNRPDDLWALLSFLGTPDLPAFENFSKAFFDNDQGRKRCQNILALIMLRRTHADRLLGAKLIDLPKAAHSRSELTMGALEHQIYDIICQRMHKHIQGIENDGSRSRRTISGPYILMLLRLRQYIAHFAILFDTLYHLLEADDLTVLETFCEEHANDTGEFSELPMAQKLVAMINRSRELQVDREMFIVNNKAEPRPNILFTRITKTPPTLKDKPHSLAFLELLNFNYAKNEIENLTSLYQCTMCRQTHSEPFITSCLCLYCPQCIDERQKMAADAGCDSDLCLCGKTYNGIEPCSEAIQVFKDALSKRGSARHRRLATEVDEDFCDANNNKKVIHSSKSRAIRDQIRRWLAESPDIKIIVFTEWQAMLRLMALTCAEEKWVYLLCHGGVTTQARTRVIDKFRDINGPRILLSSMRTGGQGLNLTMASKCIIVDPWWNTATEDQVFGRVFRLGQEKETLRVNLVVDSSVDLEIEEIKEKKDAAIHKTYLEGGQDKLPKGEWRALFGRVVQRSKRHMDAQRLNAQQMPAEAHNDQESGDHQDDDMVAVKEEGAEPIDINLEQFHAAENEGFEANMAVNLNKFLRAGNSHRQYSGRERDINGDDMNENDKDDEEDEIDEEDDDDDDEDDEDDEDSDDDDDGNGDVEDGNRQGATENEEMSGGQVDLITVHDE